MNNLVEIEFLEDHIGYKKGSRQRFSPRLATLFIVKKIAKAVDFPSQDKMVRWSHNKGIGSHFKG